MNEWLCQHGPERISVSADLRDDKDWNISDGGMWNDSSDIIYLEISY